MGGTVGDPHTTPTTSASVGSSPAAAQQTSTNPTLVKDKKLVDIDAFYIEKALTAPDAASGAGISSLQAHYNADLATYSADLTADKKANAGIPGKTQNMGPLGFDNDELDAIAGKSDKANYHQLAFTDSAAGASHDGGVAAADAFPGGQGDPEWFGAENLQKGYVDPPPLPPGASVSDAYENLTPSQAAYLGWALEKADAGKQVAIPTKDLQAWNQLGEYARQNNKELGTGNPDSSHDMTADTDDLVDSSFQTNKPSDPGKIALSALTGAFTLGLPTSVSGIIPGQAGTILGNLAGVAAGAVTSFGLGGEASDAAVSALTGATGGVVTDAVSLLNSIKGVLSSGTLSEAGSTLLSEVGEQIPSLLNGSVPDGLTLQDNLNHSGA